MSVVFSDAWLKAHEARMAAYRAGPPELPESFTFTLQRPILLLNRYMRLHWAKRREYHETLAAEVAALTRHLPAGAKPMQKARVTITRYSMGTPDQDGLIGGCKPLVDVLLSFSTVHPLGLGFVIDDSPKHLELVATGQQAEKRSAQRTVVLVEKIP